MEYLRYNFFPKVFGLLVLFFILTSQVAGMDKEERFAIAAIRHGNIEALQAYLEKHPDVNCTFSNGKTGLYYAILYDQARIARYLIEFGADVNLKDDAGNTPLIYAAELNNFELSKILIDRGADPLHTNLKGRRASDFAAHDSHSKTFGYLLFMEEEVKRLDSLSSLYDGPYIFLEEDNRLILTYYEHLPDKKLTRLYEKTIVAGEKNTVIEGSGRDEKTYHIAQNYVPGPDSLETGGKIFVLGDIHGRYDALINILINNRIIDRELKWMFGEGHLVLLGDVFDRGGSVTEVLWYLYELQIQAKKTGGDVHLLLGNHEIMAMTGDDRYINSKYRHFTEYTQTYYSTLFEKNTVLGRWLRSQHAILRINGYLFLHAGISPQFAIHDYPFSMINSRVRAFLNTKYKIKEGSPEDIILGPIGPQWYRGYNNNNNNDKISGNNNFPELTQEFVDSYLKSKGLKRMIVGHNEQAAITSSFEGKVISCDISIDENGDSLQGLLIAGKAIFRCFSDGRRERIE